MLSGKVHCVNLPVTQEEMNDWNACATMLIQNAFPNLTDDQREFILTGSTKEEWDNAFGEEE